MFTSYILDAMQSLHVVLSYLRYSNIATLTTGVVLTVMSILSDIIFFSCSNLYEDGNPRRDTIRSSRYASLDIKNLWYVKFKCFDNTLKTLNNYLTN